MTQKNVLKLANPAGDDNHKHQREPNTSRQLTKSACFKWTSCVKVNRFFQMGDLWEKKNRYFFFWLEILLWLPFVEHTQCVYVYKSGDG